MESWQSDTFIIYTNYLNESFAEDLLRLPPNRLGNTKKITRKVVRQ